MEGLGPFSERTFLDGSLEDWTFAWPIRTPANVIVSPGARKAAAALAARHGDVRARPDGSVSSPQAWIFACRADGAFSEERVAAARLEWFDARERELPSVAGQPLRVADAWVFHVEHWSDLLWANLLAIGPFLWSRLASPMSLAWAAARAGSFRPELVAGGLVERGSGCFIHPNATVEFSVVGAGARIGAGAVVRGCVLGEGAVVEELAMVEGCVLGPEAKIQRQAMAKYSVIEARAAHAGTVQLGVIGLAAHVRHGATLFDQTLGAPVRMRRGGELVQAPREIIGVCVGPYATIGQGVRIAAGRVVPPGLTILPDPAGVLTTVDIPEGTTRTRVRNGKLEPIA